MKRTIPSVEPSHFYEIYQVAMESVEAMHRPLVVANECGVTLPDNEYLDRIASTVYPLMDRVSRIVQTVSGKSMTYAQCVVLRIYGLMVLQEEKDPRFQEFFMKKNGEIISLTRPLVMAGATAELSFEGRFNRDSLFEVLHNSRTSPQT
ncbi:MAG: hypothetical protein AAGA18_14670 [Verrucomicrobiota bacterium]